MCQDVFLTREGVEKKKHRKKRKIVRSRKIYSDNQHREQFMGYIIALAISPTLGVLKSFYPSKGKKLFLRSRHALRQGTREKSSAATTTTATTTTQHASPTGREGQENCQGMRIDGGTNGSGTNIALLDAWYRQSIVHRSCYLAHISHQYVRTIW